MTFGWSLYPHCTVYTVAQPVSLCTAYDTHTDTWHVATSPSLNNEVHHWLLLHYSPKFYNPEGRPIIARTTQHNAHPTPQNCKKSCHFYKYIYIDNTLNTSTENDYPISSTGRTTLGMTHSNTLRGTTWPITHSGASKDGPPTLLGVQH